MNNAIRTFIERHGLAAAAIDAERLLADFSSEMSAGLAGAPSSLAMIPSYISLGHPVPVGKPVIVLDAGGTNLRICVVAFDSEGKPQISHFTKVSMPGIAAPVTADEFFGILAGHIRPLIPLAKDIGFCFSYAAEISPDCDGRLIRWSKEVKAPEVEGMWLGAELRKRLEPDGFKGRISVINDTVGTLLAGVSASVSRRYDGYVGFILGTGTNIAAVADNASISKLSGLPAGSMIVNAESAAFDKAPQSDIDLRYDATTVDPGHAPFEKMISGGYLGAVGLTALQVAGEEGLFSAPFAKAVASWKALENRDLDIFVENPFAAVGPFAGATLTDDDRIAVQAVAGAVYMRAAIFSAVNMAAAILLSGGGHNPLAPVCVNVDGSTYYKTRCVEFRSRIEAALRALLEPREVFYRLIGLDDSPVIGTAVAGLTR